MTRVPACFRPQASPAVTCKPSAHRFQANNVVTHVSSGQLFCMTAVGETTSREMFKGAQLPAARGTLGIATVGDALHKLIPATTPAPCSVKEVDYPSYAPGLAVLLPESLSSPLRSSNAVQQLYPTGSVTALPLPAGQLFSSGLASCSKRASPIAVLPDLDHRREQMFLCACRSSRRCTRGSGRCA